VMAHPVFVGVISGTDARVMPLILAASSCRSAKGSGLLSRAIGSTGIRRRRSSFLGIPLSLMLPLAEFEREEAREALPEIGGGLLPREEVIADLGIRKSAPEFFRVFAMSAKLTDFAEAEVGVPDDSWL